MTLRRLTVPEYTRVVQDVLGADITVSLPNVQDLSIDGSTAAGAGHVGMPSVDAESFTEAADSVSKQATSAVRRAALLCQPSAALDQACVNKQIDAIGRQLYRRPVTADQHQRLVALSTQRAAQGNDVWQGLQGALAAMLQSPYFLYRVDTIDAGTAGATSLDAHTVASRLSFLIWDRGPDPQLAALADSGMLLQSDVLRAQASRLLDDPRSSDGLMPFFSDLFRLSMIAAAQKNPNDWPLSLQSELQTQAALTIEDELLTKNNDYRSLFTTTSAFVNQDLANRYGYSPVADANFVRQDVNLNDRAGLLGLPGIQAMLAFSNRTSPTKRGLYIQSALLCTDIPSPPATVNTAVAGDPNRQVTLRQIMEQHAENPACTGCHTLMDPLGFALEDFDWLGNYRTQDQNLPLDLTGSIQKNSFVNARTLGVVLHDDPDVPKCLVQRFVLAATTKAASDQPMLTQSMQQAFVQSGYRFKDLVLAYVMSDSFRSAP